MTDVLDKVKYIEMQTLIRTSLNCLFVCFRVPQSSGAPHFSFSASVFSYSVKRGQCFRVFILMLMRSKGVAILVAEQPQKADFLYYS